MTTFEQLKQETQGYSFPLYGENEDGESQTITVGTDKEMGQFFRVTTYQSNDWIRVNIYYEDGTTEELFEGGDK